MKIILFILLSAIVSFGAVDTRIGWADQGAGTVLHGDSGPTGPLVTCTNGLKPYCTGNVATYDFLGSDAGSMEAYSGGCIDTIHNTMTLGLGGHTDTQSNAVNQWNLSTATMTRLTDPSGPVNNSGETNADGTPAARHSGQGWVYLPNENSCFLAGYGVGISPIAGHNVWFFSLSSKTWTIEATLPDTGNDTGWYCWLDPTHTAEHVMCVDQAFNFNVYDYNVIANTWSTAYVWPSGTNPGYLSTCTPSPTFKVVVCVGPVSSNNNGITVFNLSSYGYTDVTSSATNCSTLYATTNPGFAWDSSTGLFVGYSTNGGNIITLFDYASLSCVTRTYSGGPGSSGAGTINSGLFTRFAYFPLLNVFGVCNNATADCFTLKLHSDSLGHSFISSSGPCKDIDGDGYGVGSGCIGIDADDNDATIHTTAQLITKYGSIEAFLEKISYQTTAALAKVYCISNSGNDSTGAFSTNADTACTHPYLTWTNTAAILPSASPYIVIFRTGTWTGQYITFYSGTAAAQNIVMSYPGEQAIIDFSAGSGGTISIVGIAYTTVDGLRIKANPSGDGYSGGSYNLYQVGPQVVTFVWNNLFHCEISGGGSDSNAHADNVIQFDTEENVMHDPDPSAGQHNVYYGSNTVASTGIRVNRNILYNIFTSGYPNLQINGRCLANCYIEQNWLYSADGQQIALLMGFSNGFVRNNLMYNTGSFGNPGVCFTLNDYSSGSSKIMGAADISAWDQTNNVIENNTCWTGTLAPSTGGAVSGEAFHIVNSTSSGDWGAGAPNIGGNFYRNNIIVDLSSTSGAPPVYYDANNSTNYLPLDTWTNTIINSATGFVAGAASNSFTCSTFSSTALSGSGCSTLSPGFTAASTSYYNTPQSFNFVLLSGSAALAAGTPVGASPFDLIGTVRSNPPSLGAYDTTQSSPVGGGSILGGKFKLGGAAIIH